MFKKFLVVFAFLVPVLVWWYLARLATEREEAVAAYRKLAAEHRAMVYQKSLATPKTHSTQEGPPVAWDLLLREWHARATLDPAWMQFWDELLGKQSEQIPKEDIERLGQFFDVNPDMATGVRRFAAQGWHGYTVDLSKGIAAELPHLANVRQYGRILRAQAMLAAHRGNTEQALADALAIFSLAAMLRAEPMVISQLVRVAIIGIAVDAIEAVSAQTPLTAGQTHRVVDVLKSVDLHPGLTNAVLTEGEFYLQMMENVQVGELEQYKFLPLFPNDNLAYFHTTLFARPLLDSEARLITVYARRIAAFHERPYFEVWDELKALQAEIDHLPDLRVFTKAALPSFMHAAEAQARAETQLDLAMLGLLIELFHNETGAYPESLAALPPMEEVTARKDPFTGAPFKYMLEPQRMLLYSLGPNRTDDNGAHHLVEADIVWRGTEDAVVVH